MLEGDARSDEQADAVWRHATNTLLPPQGPVKCTPGDYAAANMGKGSSSADPSPAVPDSNEEAPDPKRARRAPPTEITHVRDGIQRALSEWDRMPDFPADRIPPIAEFNPSVHAAMSEIRARRDVVEENLVTLHDLDSVAPLRNYDTEYARLTAKILECNRSLFATYA